MNDDQAPDHKARMPGDVLVVEDALIIALDIESILEQIGVASVRIATTTDQALAAIGERAPDFAIVDYNLGDDLSDPITHELARRGIPFVIATGDSLAPDDLRASGAVRILYKPFHRDDIADAVLRGSIT